MSPIVAAGEWDRSNIAVYSDVEFGGQDDPWAVGVAARIENFADFGTTVNALLHNSGRVTDRSQSCLNAIEFALTQACPGLTYDSVPHI